MALQIRKKNIANNEIDGSKLKLLHGQTLRGTNAQGEEIDVLAEIAQDASSKLAEAKSYTDDKVGLVLNNLDTPALDSLNEVVTAFQTADSNLNGAITSLATGLSADIAAEQSARQSADQALEAALSSAQSSVQAGFASVEGAIVSEASTRASADLELSGLISSETSARQSADSALDSRTTSLEGRATSLEGNVSTLQSEMQVAQSDIGTLQGQVAAFQGSASGDITALQTQVSNHIAQTIDAHDASAISLLDAAGYFTATNVEDTFIEIHDYVTANVIEKYGSVAMAADLDLGTHNIINVVDPVNAQDASTKAYVDADGGAESIALDNTTKAMTKSKAVLTDAGTNSSTKITLPAISGLQVGQTFIIVNSTSTSLNGAGGVYQSNGVTMIGTGFPAGHRGCFTLISKTPETWTSHFLILRAGSGYNFANRKLINVTDPTNAQDGATKFYVDSKVTDAIVDGVTTSAPSQNAVFDALALKASITYVDSQDTAKLVEAKAYADSVGAAKLAEGKTYTDGKITDLINGAPAMLDTLKEIADQLASDESTAVALANSLANEVSRAQGEESRIEGKVDAETSARQSAVSSLESALTSAQSSFTTAINNEVSARQSADSALSSDIAAKLVEAKSYADTKKSEAQSYADSAVLVEKNRAESAEAAKLVEAKGYTDSVASSLQSAVTTAITNEASARSSADSALSSRVSVLEAKVFVKESITLVADDITAGYVDLTNVAAANSIVAFIGRLGMHQDYDFTVSVVSGKTRITFKNGSSLIGDGAEAPAVDDVFFFTYYK